MTGGGLLHAAVLVQTAATAICGGLTAAHFLCLLRGELTPGRRTAARALALVGAGAALHALALVGSGVEPLTTLAVGLPACGGQVLCALLVARERRRRE